MTVILPKQTGHRCKPTNFSARYQRFFQHAKSYLHSSMNHLSILQGC